MRRPTLLPAFLVFSAAFASPALGADPPSAKPAQAPPAAKPEVERTSDPVVVLFAQAQAAFAKGDTPGAYKAYLEAWALQKSYDIAGNLGNVELKLGKPRDAAEHLAYAHKNFPPTGDPTLKEALHKKLGEAEDQVARMRVSVTQEGANIWVNGKLVGISPLRDTLYLEPGEITVEVKFKGFRDERRVVRIDRGRGELVGVTLTAEAPPPPPKKRSMVPAIVAGGLAVGAAATGVGLFVASNGKRDDTLALDKSIVHQDHQRCVPPGPIDTRCAERDSLAREGDTFHNAAVGAFVGAGVLAVGALTYLLWPAPKAQKAKLDVHAAPVLGTGQGGIIISGAF